MISRHKPVSRSALQDEQAILIDFLVSIEPARLSIHKCFKIKTSKDNEERYSQKQTKDILCCLSHR